MAFEDVFPLSPSLSPIQMELTAALVCSLTWCVRRWRCTRSKDLAASGVIRRLQNKGKQARRLDAG